MSALEIHPRWKLLTKGDKGRIMVQHCDIHKKIEHGYWEEIFSGTADEARKKWAELKAGSWVVEDTYGA